MATRTIAAQFPAAPALCRTGRGRRCVHNSLARLRMASDGKSEEEDAEMPRVVIKAASPGRTVGDKDVEGGLQTDEQRTLEFARRGAIG